MAFGSTDYRLATPAVSPIAALAAEDSCVGHAVIARLTTPRANGRDLADAVHALCAVHGRATALFADTVGGIAASTGWLDRAATAFAVERGYLARLTAAVGPLPSTPGQAESDAAFAAQRHAFDMLARSARTGCASGAALALVIDWHALRPVLDAAATRVGVAIPASGLPDEIEIATIATAPDQPAPVLRAMAFGAQQVFAQHRGLCDLIEARAIARDQL